MLSFELTSSGKEVSAPPFHSNGVMGHTGTATILGPALMKFGDQMLVFGGRGNRGFYRTNVCLPTEWVSEAEQELKDPGAGPPPGKV